MGSLSYTWKWCKKPETLKVVLKNSHWDSRLFSRTSFPSVSLLIKEYAFVDSCQRKLAERGTANTMWHCEIASFPVAQYTPLLQSPYNNEVDKGKWVLDSAYNLCGGIKLTVSCLNPCIRLCTVTQLLILFYSTQQHLAQIVHQHQEIQIRVEL